MSNASTRLKIREAALRLFLQHGFTKTSIADIERAAGLAPRAGAFYRHFDSKQTLLVELAKEYVSETPDEFHFEELLAYRNTRAELVAIAHVYENAAERQRPFLRLIDEIRLLDYGTALESDVNATMLDALMRWVATKPAAARWKPPQLAAMTMCIFGGWLFYLGKSQQGVQVPTLSRDTLLDVWASHWAAHLDHPG